MALTASAAVEEQARKHAQTQLRELRAWNLIAACLWQATATAAAVRVRARAASGFPAH
jgi:hypothetical protein